MSSRGSFAIGWGDDVHHAGSEPPPPVSAGLSCVHRRLTRFVARCSTLAALVTAAVGCTDPGYVASVHSTGERVTSTTVATTTSIAASVPPTALVSVAPMVVEIAWAPSARWADGARPSAADLECTRRAALESGDPSVRRRYASVAAIRDDATTGNTIIEFSSLDTGYRRLFDGIVHGVNGSCASSAVSGALTVGQPASASVRLIDGGGAPGLPDVLASGTVAMEVGQPRSIPEGLPVVVSPAAAGPMVSLVLSRTGPLADELLRRAVFASIDRDAGIEEAFTPLAPASALAVCGPWPATSPLCAGTAFQDTFDADGASRSLTDSGWTRDRNGYWAKDGVVPVLSFVVAGGDRAAVDLQTSIAPRLSAAGFDVRVAICSAQCRADGVTRFDITVATAGIGDAPDIDALVACGIDDTAAGLGPCDPTVTGAMAEVRSAPTPPARVAAAQRLAKVLADQSLVLPMAAQPRTVAWRSDVVADGFTALAAMSLTDLLAADSRRTASGTQEQLTVAVDVYAWCDEPWWRCPASVADAMPGGVRRPALWEPSASGPVPSSLVAGEPRSSVAPVG